MRQVWLCCCLALAGCGGAEDPAEQQRRAAEVSSPAAGAAGAEAGAGRAETGLCQPGEDVIFQCSAGREMVAVCAGQAGAGTSYVQYRFGSPGNIELAYPAERRGGPGTLKWARTGYSGGGEAQIGFTNGGHQYVVYSRVVRTGFGADGQNNPQEEAGLFVKKDGKLVSEKKCVPGGEADGQAPSVDTTKAEALLPEGEIVYPEE